MMNIGRVCEIVRYPVKSMAGIPTDSAILDWHGLDGDRRFAFRRAGDNSGFTWISASRLPELLLYHPTGLDETTGEPLPTHVRTPSGSCLELQSAELKAELSERFGSGLDLMKLKHGIFDEATISVISLATIAGIGREAGLDLDRRRFRANIFLETQRSEPFLEDEWVGGMLLFGDSDPHPAVSVTLRDVRCMMINLNPDTAQQDARVMKTVVRLNKNNAGVYATVVRSGTIRVGDKVSLHTTEMSDPVEALIADLLQWIGVSPRPYNEVMEAWRTSCPKLPVWEEANNRGFITYEHKNGVRYVSISALGQAFLMNRPGAKSSSSN